MLCDNTDFMLLIKTLMNLDFLYKSFTAILCLVKIDKIANNQTIVNNTLSTFILIMSSSVIVYRLSKNSIMLGRRMSDSLRILRLIPSNKALILSDKFILSNLSMIRIRKYNLQICFIFSDNLYMLLF